MTCDKGKLACVMSKKKLPAIGILNFVDFSNRNSVERISLKCMYVTCKTSMTQENFALLPSINM